MHLQYHPVLTYSIYYRNKPVPERNLDRLSGIDRDTTIKLLCRIKMTFSRERHRDPNNPFMNWYIGLLPDGHAARLRSLLYGENAAHFIAVPLTINQVLVDLMNEDKAENDGEYNHPAYISLAVLETLMIYNDHHFHSVVVSGREDNHDLLWELSLMQDLNGKNQASFVRTGMIKQAIFLTFLKQQLQDNYDEFAKTLSAKLGIPELVYVALLYVNLQLCQDNRMAEKDPLMTISPDNQAYSVIEKLSLVCDGQQNAPTHSISNLMMKPFIRLANNYLSFTGTHDFALISEVGWAHFLHKEGTLVSLLPNLKKDNQFWAWIGTYIEKFLLATVFKTFHQTGLRVISSDDLKTPDITLILNETDVFIIEIKSSSLHFKDWESQDLPAFKKYLTDSFISEKKGAIQLHKCLQHLANDPEGLFGLRKPLRKLKIYPVIVYTEPHVSTVAVNDFIIKNAPAVPEELAKEFGAIQPLTMIDCDFFLENSKVLREKKRLIKDAILHYHQTISLRKKQYQKVNSTVNFSKAMETFDNVVIGFDGLYRQDQMIIADEVKMMFDVSN
jgi:hypothetical protein